MDSCDDETSPSMIEDLNRKVESLLLEVSTVKDSHTSVEVSIRVESNRDTSGLAAIDDSTIEAKNRSMQSS